MRFITVTVQFCVTVATICQLLRCCMDINYVVGEQGSSILLCSVSNVNILMWIFEVWYAI
jgi:hypothetical protein